MFSGIITDLGKVVYFDLDKKIIEINTNFNNLFLGQSISCSGICLTVAKINKHTFFCNLVLQKKSNMTNAQELNAIRSTVLVPPTLVEPVHNLLDFRLPPSYYTVVVDWWVSRRTSFLNSPDTNCS